VRQLRLAVAVAQRGAYFSGSKIHWPSGGGCAQKMRQVAPSTSAFDGLLEKVELKTSARSRTGTQTLHQLALVAPQALSCYDRRHGRNSCRHDKEERYASRQGLLAKPRGAQSGEVPISPARGTPVSRALLLQGRIWCEKLHAQGAAGHRSAAPAAHPGKRECAAAGRTKNDAHRGEREAKCGYPTRFLRAAPRTAVSGNAAGCSQSPIQAQSGSGAGRPTDDMATRPEAAAAVEAGESLVTFAAWAFSLSSRSVSWVHARMDAFRAGGTGTASTLPA